MTPATEKQPDLENRNPFDLIAYVVFRLRHALEDPDPDGGAPRWVRIARAMDTQGSADVVGKVVKLGVNGLAEALSYMIELTLDMEELLIQTDAAKALTNLS